MKRLVLSAVLLGMLATGGPVAAQVVISPQYDVQLRGLAVGPSITVAEPVVVGGVLPGEVTLAPLPGEIGPYSYVVWNNRTVIVDPGTRRVIRVVE